MTPFWHNYIQHSCGKFLCGLIFWGYFCRTLFWNILGGQLCGAFFFWDTLMGRFCGTLIYNTLRTLLWITFVGCSTRKNLVG